jgi:hypothetical protein
VKVNRKLADNYNDGYRSFSKVERRNGRFHIVANPFKKNTTPYREWQRGWNKAYLENMEQLNGLGTRS